MKTEGFKYYAFISYSHKDKKLAKKLQRHLQSYHLPSALLKSNPDLPKKISPVFMDESNLVASRTLREALHDNLDNSNYLIVICSPNSAKSEYVNDEVEYFINSGRTDHIIPFIIDGEPHASDSSVECFPQAILNLPREHELLGIDMKKFGVRDSFSRVIATLLSLDLDNFVNYEHRRRIRKIVTLSSMAAVIMIAAGIFIWNNIIPHIKYYHTYVYRWEKPVGLFEVKESERRKKEYTYRFTSVGGKVKMIERVNSAGILVDPTIITPFTELPMIRFVSDRTVEYYDVNGKKIYRKEYTKNFEAVDFYRGDEDLPYAIQPETSDYSVNKYTSELGSKQNIGNIIRLTLEHDNNGYLIREMFRMNNHGGYDQKGVPVQDAKGRGGLGYILDDTGRVIVVRYMDKDRDHQGVYAEHIEYGNSPYPMKITYADKNDNLVLNPQGISSIAIVYDDFFNAEKLSYYGINEERAMNNDEDISEIVFVHDSDNGFLASERFYDDKLNPCVCSKEDYSRVEFARNAEGRIIERFFYGIRGESITYSGGVAFHNDEDAYKLGDKYYMAEDYTKAYEWYRKSAENGHAKAQRMLGIMYNAGWGVEQDSTQAFFWYQKSAENGLIEGQYELGWMYHHGYGVEQDSAKAIEWYEKAGGQGETTAQFLLGYLYHYGKGIANGIVEQDNKRAFEWWKKAAEQGDSTSQYCLGAMYHYGYGVDQDYRKAVEWYEKAVAGGNVGIAEWTYDLGITSYSGNGIDQADKQAKGKSLFRLADAQYKLGRMYQYGKGAEKDYRQAVEWYQKAADGGLAEAQDQLGSMYANGYGVIRNDKRAFEWYQKAAAQEYAEAQFNLGSMYRNARGVEKNNRKTLELYMKAANQGYSPAQSTLGYMYRKGDGVEQDGKQAVEWYQKAAGRGDAVGQLAQYNLGNMYYDGDAVEQDYTKAFRWYQMAAENGVTDAQFLLGVMYENAYGIEQNYNQAIECYRKAAEKGHVGALNNLGVMYEYGKGVEQDYIKAVEWYRKSAEHGYELAQSNLGNMYYHGKGVEQDYIKAAEWYRKAAGRIIGASANAGFSLGIMYFYGYGVEKDYKKAVEWWIKAAEHGHVKAQSNLGIMYRNGYGTEKNDKQAVYWWTKAAEQGNFSAQYNLGVMYDFGYGVVQNYEQAFRWYSRSAEQGDADAQNNLGYMYQNGNYAERNYDKAVQLYLKSAEQGNKIAQKNMGIMYQNGWGVEKDLQTAYMWYCLACLSGNKSVSENLKNINGLTESQINEAKSQAQKKFNEIQEKNK